MKAEDIPIVEYTHFVFSLIEPKTFRPSLMVPKTVELSQASRMSRIGIRE